MSATGRKRPLARIHDWPVILIRLSITRISEGPGGDDLPPGVKRQMQDQVRPDDVRNRTGAGAPLLDRFAATI